eukprot:CAMPEP_0196664858 /NCGR_PEP_ID=MMETSP1086-20130531/58711_1 /TAXON_ID=77921 /ORGANISM="Cyanoptyche  gloeocystis , Strain SAG4.97" /LENGTH=78 /DNA_ID=CAMNT_0042001345 /DNA_START=43 /DNA_END=276 /DNA_ORIENTATION=-
MTAPPASVFPPGSPKTYDHHHLQPATPPPHTTSHPPPSHIPLPPLAALPMRTGASKRELVLRCSHEASATHDVYQEQA